MQVLSVHQPGATLLVLGFQRLEVRSWQTRHRGPLAIHAARRRREPELPMGWYQRLHAAWKKFGLTGWGNLYPRGAVLGVVDLIDCVRFEDLPTGEPSEAERMLTHFAPNVWVWRFAAPRPLASPVPMRGQQGLFLASLPEVTHVELA